jgi:hypothetical protein
LQAIYHDRTAITRLAAGTAIAVVALVAAGPAASAPPPAHLSRAKAIAIAVSHPEIARWLERYPRSRLVRAAEFDKRTRTWSVQVVAGAAGEVASAKIDDATGRVSESLAGPQVAWQLARGGGVGGKTLNRGIVWIAFCVIFFVGLADPRRPFGIRNLDLLALLSLSFSLWEFNRGHVFAADALVYPPLAYLIVRCAWIAARGRRDPTPSRWPVWVLVAATVFLVSFQIGLDLHSANIIDVGYAGVIGAQRLTDGRTPYGTFPQEGTLPACGTPDASGEIHERIQPNGHCERALPMGDTYGPVTYEAYVPGLELFGWTGRWDRLPAARFSTIVFDLLALGGLAAVGRRFGGDPLAATFAFAWAAYPFTQYAANSGTNDTLMPALLLLGFLALTIPAARGASVALAGWSKFAAFIVAPLWATYPSLERPRRVVSYAYGFAAATVLSVWVIFLDGRPLHAVRVFYARTVQIQFDRHSPFSLWDWPQYHAGLPDLHLVQRALQVLLVVTAIALPFVPRRKDALQLAALTGLLLVGFEVVLTHWTYYYIPWFFPFVLFGILGADTSSERPGTQA